MVENRKTIFISDIHLDENNPAIARIFLQFLSNVDSTIDAIYILGDLFETWIGDDDDSEFHLKIKQALKLLISKGIPIYFLHGNRDFLIGKKFIYDTGCICLPDETKLQIYQTPVLIMHGDTLCTNDHSYIKARKKMRNTFLQKLFLFLPLTFRKKIAEKIRATSKQHTAITSQEIMDVTQSEVERVMENHVVYYLIHGHTHRPNIHTFNLKNSKATRVVLGAWHEKGNMLVWNETGEMEYIEFS